MSLTRRWTRRGFLKAGGTAAAGIALPCGRVQAAGSFDVVIHGGTVLDGTGSEPFQADLGIVGERIAALGRIPPRGPARDRRRGPARLPGLHRHPQPLGRRHPAVSHGRQPRPPGCDDRGDRQLRRLGGADRPGARRGSAQGVARAGHRRVLVGWSIRTAIPSPAPGSPSTRRCWSARGRCAENAIGLVDRHLTPDELRAVERALEEGMEQGAFGLSSGLEYTPGRYTPPEEIVALAARRRPPRRPLRLPHPRRGDRPARGRRRGDHRRPPERRARRDRTPESVGTAELEQAAGRPRPDRLGPPGRGRGAGRRLSVHGLFHRPDHPLPGGGARRGHARDDAAAARPAVACPHAREIERKMASELGDYALIVIARVKTPANQHLLGKNVVEVAQGVGRRAGRCCAAARRRGGRVRVHRRARHEPGKRRDRAEAPARHGGVGRFFDGPDRTRRADAPAPALLRRICARARLLHAGDGNCFRSPRRSGR